VHHGFDASKARGHAPPAAAPRGTPVSVATVAESDVAAWDEFSGRLEAVERVDVRSRVAGAVQAVHFREGALVQKGDLLITIDPAPYAAEVERAEAQVGAAQARQSHAQRARARPAPVGRTARSRSANYEERAQRGAKPSANLRAAQARCRPRA
jgi:multidrug efflux system membrane fusion protein